MYPASGVNCFILFSLLQILVIFVPLGVTSLSGSSDDDGIKIRVQTSGSDTAECWKGLVPCRTLDYATRKEDLNRTTVVLSREVHKLNSIIRLQYISEFQLIAEPEFGVPDAVINCTGQNSGLYISSGHGIFINNIAFENCGAVFNSTNMDGKRSWNISTAMHLRECSDVRLSSVRLSSSFGFGAVFYDVVGEVTFSNVSFVNNRLTELYTDPGYASGGGIYIEFLPSCASGMQNYTKYWNSIYTLDHCIFQNNTAEHIVSTASESNCKQFISFGRGGGLSYIARGNARNNTLKITNCSFADNKALWGGGIFAEFDDQAGNNSIFIQYSVFRRNQALLGGGGMRVGINSDRYHGANTVSLLYTQFVQNNAQVGGGYSQYRPENAGKSTEKVEMKSCIFNANTGIRGSAIQVSLVHLHFHSGRIEDNTFHKTTDVLQGEGAIYCFSTILFFYKKNMIIRNAFTALMLEASYAIIYEGPIFFSSNTGFNGGAIGIFAEAGVTLVPGSIVHFNHNSASKKGGAIYVERPVSSQRPMNSTELRTRDCFISFGKNSFEYLDPDDSNTSTSFLGNKAYDASGQNIYATSISMCRRNDESVYNNSAFLWKTFHYNGDSPLKTVVTRSFEMKVIDAQEWNAYPGLPFSPKVVLNDENANEVYGDVQVSIFPKIPGTVSLTGSGLFLVKDKVPSLNLLGRPLAEFSVRLETTEGAPLIKVIRGLKLRNCPLGFYFDNKTRECRCISNKQGLIYGVTRCESRSEIYILRGRWGNPKGLGNKFAMHYCPDNYCRSSAKSAQQIDHRFNQKEQCEEGRDPNSILCGKCKPGLSVNFGNEKCQRCEDSFGVFWLLLLIAAIALFVLVVMLINSDVYSTSLNAFLYSYQIIPLCTLSNKTLDPFIDTLMSFVNFAGSGQINVGVCLWENMNDLEKTFLNYLLPISMILCTVIISHVSSRLSNRCTFNRRTTFRAFVFISVLAYSDITRITFTLLHPIEIENQLVLFKAGDISFFGKAHAPYAAIALMFLFFIVILFPVALIFSNYIVARPAFVKFMGIFDTFQEPYRPAPGLRFFSAFYFINRVIILVIYVYVPHGCRQDTLLAAVCIIILFIFAYIKPYSNEWMNLYDAVLLTNIAVLAVINIGLNGIEQKRSDLQNTAHALSYLPLLCLCVKFSIWLYLKIQSLQETNKSQTQGRRRRNPFPQRLDDAYVPFKDQAA